MRTTASPRVQSKRSVGLKSQSRGCDYHIPKMQGLPPRVRCRGALLLGCAIVGNIAPTKKDMPRTPLTIQLDAVMWVRTTRFNENPLPPPERLLRVKPGRNRVIAQCGVCLNDCTWCQKLLRSQQPALQSLVSGQISTPTGINFIPFHAKWSSRCAPPCCLSWRMSSSLQQATFSRPSPHHVFPGKPFPAQTHRAVSHNWLFPPMHPNPP